MGRNRLDISGSLATSIIGDIPVLAMRLDMTWRTPRHGIAELKADGGGYDFTPTKIQGLRTVTQFSVNHVNPQERPINPYIPSRNRDEMLSSIGH